MSTNKTNFTGWSGNTFDITKLNLTGTTTIVSQKSSLIINGPVVINKDRPKNSKITPGTKQPPVAKVKTIPNPVFSGATKLGRPSTLSSKLSLESTGLPFTAGTIDTSFPNGINTGFDGDVFVSKIQSDGKILVGGDFTHYEYNGSNYYSPYLIRINSDGSPDFNFYYTLAADDNGWNIDGSVYTIDIQSDGKILIGGTFNYYYEDSSWYSPKIMRFNSNGTFDNTFNVGDGFNNTVFKIIVQPDNKILVCGEFDQYNNSQTDPSNGPAYWRIIRLTEYGSPDTTFNVGFGINWNDGGTVYDMVLQPDGKIILGGDFFIYDQSTSYNIARINSNGSYDNTFVVGDGFNDTVRALALQSDGKVIVGGYFDTYNYIDLYNGYIVRLKTNGDLDTRFGYGLDNGVHSLVIQSDDKILVGGYMGTFYIDSNNNVSIDELVRFQSDCTFDYSFYFDNRLDSGVLSINLDSDNKIYIGGNFYEDGGPYLLNHFGRLNNSILEYPYTYTVEACAQPLNDQTTTYVVGSMTPLNGDPTYSFQSLQNPSITVCGFITETYPSNVIEYVMVNTYNNCEDAYISNYNLVLVEDFFGSTNITDYWVVDNKYEVGDFLYINTIFDGMGRTYAKFAAKIISFLPWTYAEYPIWEQFPAMNYVPYSSGEAAIEANGLHYVAYSCSEEEVSYPLIHKPYYNDVTLLIPTGSNPVKFLVDYIPMNNYNLISGGTSEIYSTIELGDGENCVDALSKFSPNGQLNYSFQNSGFDGSLVYTTVEQPDGKILVGGNFNDYLEVNVNNFMRINPDGSLDSTFNSVYCNSPVWNTMTPFSSTSSGSIYFDGTPLCEVSANTDQGVWNLGNNNVTFEWFQYFTGDLSHLNPTVFDYSNNDLRVYFSQGDVITVVIDGDGYTYDLNSPINDVWCHIAVTRYYDSEEDFYIWRVFQNGIQLGQFNYSFSFNQSEPLLIGNSTNPYDNRGFKGYITNFRVDNGEAIYTSNFDVPTEPLDPNYNAGGGNIVLCLSVNNESDYILDNCDDEIPTSVNTPDNFLNGGFDSYIRAIALQPDGKILVGGNFNNYNNSFSGKIIRLNSDGSIDQGFTYSNEFNGTVRAIAVQKDGKIVVGGDFSYYYDFYCPQIVRLNTDGTPDPTFVMGDGFDGDQVFTINIESILNTPFYSSNYEVPTYTENIIVGGWFSWYNGTNVGGIVKLSPTGDVLPDFGGGFNRDTGDRPRVNQIVEQPDGKLIIIGGADGGYLRDYNQTWIPQNIVRLVKYNETYIIDTTFTTRDFDSSGGFNGGGVLSASILSNGKIMVGGQFDYYGDNNNDHNSLPYLVRLNSDGTLDETFTFVIDDNYVNKVLLLSSGIVLVGGRFNTPDDKLLELFIGEEYELRSFQTCNGLTSNIFLPKDFPITASGAGTEFSATPITYELISTDGLELVYDGSQDDNDWQVALPTPFDINFLGINYTTINVSTNPYITFGEGGNPSTCCFDIPNQIPSDVELPGVFISFQCDAPHSPGDYDADMLQLYTGLTDGGNTLIIKYFGEDHCNNIIPLNYTYRFYKDNSDYFDLLIDNNTLFFNGDPTGGVSNGVDETWVTTFDSTGGNAYRIGYSTGEGKPIKANVNDRTVVCGTVGEVITTPRLNTNNIGIPGSMYFDGTIGHNVTVDNNINMDLDFGSWTIEWFQKYTSTDTCCRRVFDIGSFSSEHIGASLEDGSIFVWVESTSYPYTLNTSISNTWCHFAISAENIGGDNWILRVFQDGIQLGTNITLNTDINNFDGPTALPLTIGTQGNGNSPYEGYITNFRWNRGNCYYTSNFDVPTSPLTVNGSQLLLLATTSPNLIYDSSETQTISQNGVTWSTLNPFSSPYDFSLFTSTNSTSYESCDDCGQLFNTILYVRTGISNYVTEREMTKTNIDMVLINGPIFTTRGVETYEIINYYY